MVKRLVVYFLASILGVCSLIAQVKVSGLVVSDIDNEPVIGASVLVMGTTLGTITDIQGRFEIPLCPADAKKVKVSFIGLKSAEFLISSNMVVRLAAELEQLDEVVVVAYGTARKSDFTGSATRVDASKIMQTSPTNAASALQGLSAGVSVVNNVGSPGSDPTITIRGVGSITGSTTPLYVVDGVPYQGNLSDISSADIESMTILKDAAASSLYGSRAANGVVMIQTKKGKGDRISVNLSARWAMQDLAVSLPKNADAGTYYEYQWEALYNDKYYGTDFKHTTDDMDDAAARAYASQNVVKTLIRGTTDSSGNTVYIHPYDTNEPIGLDGKLKSTANRIWSKEDTDWYGAYLDNNRLKQEYSLSVSGSTSDKKTNYLFSGSFLDDKGFAYGQLFNRYTLRSNIDSKITPWASVGLNMSYTHSRKTENTSGTRFIRNSPSYASPWLRNTDNTDWVYNENSGERMLHFGTYYLGGWSGSNYLSYTQATDSDNSGSYYFNTSYTDMFSGRAYAEFDIIEGLKFRSNLSLDNSNYKRNAYGSAIHGSTQSGTSGWGSTVLSAGGSATRVGTRRTSTTWNNLLTYRTQISDDHNINLLLGQELYAMNYEYMYAYGAGIALPNMHELSSTTGNYSVSSYTNKYRLLSFFGRAEYNYKNRYYVSGSMRKDGSSRFHKDSRWGTFYSGGGSWRISQEGFMTDISWINNMTIRASYGTTGNDNTGSYYAYQGTYESNTLYGNAGYSMASIATPELKWEQNVQFNAAVDFQLFDRLNGTIEYFERSSNDLLYSRDVPLSAVAGSASSYNCNMGDIKNSGVEFTLGFLALKKKNFSWDVNYNITYLKNEITSLPDGEYIIGNGNNEAYYKFYEGGTRYSFIAPRYAGVDPETGQAQYWKKIFDEDGKVIERVLTTNWNDVSSVNQMDEIGTAIPKFYGSLSNSFQYKNMDFSFMLYYSMGSYLYDHMYSESSALRQGFSLCEDIIGDRWQKPGDITDVPMLQTTDYTLMRKYSDRFLYKNDFLRLRNISLGYSLPKAILNKAGLNNARIYFTGVNLLTLGNAANRYTDPEANASGSVYNGSDRGGNLGASKSYTIGIDISF